MATTASIRARVKSLVDDQAISGGAAHFRAASPMASVRREATRLRAACVLLAVPAFCTPLALHAQEGDGGSAGGATSGTSGAQGGDNDGAAAASGGGNPFAGGDASGILGMSGLAFQPGFGGGCVAADSFSGAGEPGVYDSLELTSASAGNDGRYAQLSVSASETYTDNLNQESDDEAMSDYITAVSPRLDACSQTGRIRGQLSYQLEGLIYANNSQYNDVYNDIQAETTIELVPGRFYLDADTRYGQTVVDPSINFSASNSIRPDQNKTTAWVSNVSPYLVQSLGPVGQAMLRYRYGYSDYGDRDVPDSTVQGVFLNITSPEAREPLSYQFSALTQRVERSGGDESRFLDRFPEELQDSPFLPDEEALERDRTTYFDRVMLDLGYRLTRTLQLVGAGGLENRYNRDGTNERLEEPFWNAGFRWNSARNSLEARVGDRYYGTSYEFSASHDGRLFDTQVGYDEETTNQALNTLNGGGSVGAGSSGGGFGGFGGFGGTMTSQFDRGVFVQKQLSASVDFDTALTETRLTASRQEREYQDSDEPDETYKRLDLETRYDITRRMTFVPRARWQNREGSSRGGEYDTYAVGTSLIRSLTPTSQGAVGYVRSWRDDDSAASEYEENRIVVQYRKSF